MYATGVHLDCMQISFMSFEEVTLGIILHRTAMLMNKDVLREANKALTVTVRNFCRKAKRLSPKAHNCK